MGRGRRLLAVGRALFDTAVDLLFPPACTSCGREGVWLCEVCERSLSRHTNAQCPLCGKPFWRGFVCLQCQTHSPLAQCIAAFQYSDERVARVVHALKYGFVAHSAPAMARCMAEAWKEVQKEDYADLLCVPIPLHAKRFAERGFNQAELLARECARRIGCASVLGVLTRTRATTPQSQLTRADRARNIHDAFVCTKPEVLTNTRVLLIDDVLTTGATLQEAARVLKDNGAREVRALTFAHG